MTCSRPCRADCLRGKVEIREFAFETMKQVTAWRKTGRQAARRALKSGNSLVWLGGIGYYAYFEGSASGQTVGKRATSIRVISSLDGGPIGFGRGLLRYLGKIISGIAIGLGYLWMLWDPERQTWQDKIANTFVVPVSAYPVRAKRKKR